MKCHYMPIRMAKIKKSDHWSTEEDVEKLEPLYTAGENVNWYCHTGKQFGSFLKG